MAVQSYLRLPVARSYVDVPANTDEPYAVQLPRWLFHSVVRCRPVEFEGFLCSQSTCFGNWPNTESGCRVTELGWLRLTRSANARNSWRDITFPVGIRIVQLQSA